MVANQSVGVGREAEWSLPTRKYKHKRQALSAEKAFRADANAIAEEPSPPASWPARRRLLRRVIFASRIVEKTLIVDRADSVGVDSVGRGVLDARGLRPQPKKAPPRGQGFRMLGAAQLCLGFDDEAIALAIDAKFEKNYAPAMASIREPNAVMRSNGAGYFFNPGSKARRRGFAPRPPPLVNVRGIPASSLAVSRLRMAAVMVLVVVVMRMVHVVVVIRMVHVVVVMRMVHVQ